LQQAGHTGTSAAPLINIKNKRIPKLSQDPKENILIPAIPRHMVTV
jgi:hypothetical protein